jgi:trigger factor
MRPGQVRDVNITFPVNYYPELAGKAVVFKVSMKQVK